MTESTNTANTDYYHGKPKLWPDDWFSGGLFRSGKWMSGSMMADAIPKAYDCYHPYVCHVCKRGPALQKTTVSSCSGCKVVKYCGRAHQKLDWANHKRWCKAFQECSTETTEDRPVTDQTSLKEYSFAISQAMTWKCSDIKLHSTQIQLVVMQPRCRKCYAPGAVLPKGDLLSCPKCSGVAVCRTCLGDNVDNNASFHVNIDDCAEHVLSLACTGMVTEQGTPLVAHSDTNSTTQLTPKDWYEYFDKKRNDFNNAIPSFMMTIAPVMAFMTDGLTFPMTIQHVMATKVPATKNPKSLVIHVVGAASSESVALRGFLELARINPQLEYIKVYLIGPSIIMAETSDIPWNSMLMSNDVRVSHCTGGVTLLKGLYHDMVPPEEPDLVISYHAGITEPTHLRNWRATLEIIRDRKHVFCITGYNHDEVMSDVALLKDEFGFSNILTPPVCNPFRGLRPFLDPLFEGSDFIYSNASFAVLQG